MRLRLHNQEGMMRYDYRYLADAPEHTVNVCVCVCVCVHARAKPCQHACAFMRVALAALCAHELPEVEGVHVHGAALVDQGHEQGALLGQLRSRRRGQGHGSGAEG